MFSKCAAKCYIKVTCTESKKGMRPTVVEKHSPHLTPLSKNWNIHL